MKIQLKKGQKRKTYVLLHDIRSVHNVGSIFRTADALGVEKIFLSGFTPTPLDRFGRVRSDFIKVSLGAEKSVSWQYVKSPKKLLAEMKKDGARIIALEQAKNSVDYKKVKVKGDALFVVGSEVEGIHADILKLCDIVAEILMKGVKESLNVSVAFGVALFRILNQ